MNEHDARKIGEVLAFTHVGLDTLQRGGDALEKVFDQELVDMCFDTTEQLLDQLGDIVERSEFSDSILAKAEATENKLVQMRDLYLQDEWDDPTELMEWLGFFEGAAIVHWGLVQGIGERVENTPLRDTAGEAINFHQELLLAILQILKESGQKS
jgi:hypothetical protein